MKIVLKITFGFVILVTAALVFYKAKEVNTIVETTKKVEANDLPNFLFTSIDGSDFTNNDLLTGKSVVVIYFNSGCEYCDDKAKQLAYYSNEFKKSIVLFISSEKVPAIKEFAEKHSLLNHSNFVILQSNNNHFYQIFGTDFIPAILVFNTKGELLVKIDDVVPIKTIIKYVRAANNIDKQ